MVWLHAYIRRNMLGCSSTSQIRKLVHSVFKNMYRFPRLLVQLVRTAGPFQLHLHVTNSKAVCETSKRVACETSKRVMLYFEEGGVVL